MATGSDSSRTVSSKNELKTMMTGMDNFTKSLPNFITVDQKANDHDDSPLNI